MKSLLTPICLAVFLFSTSVAQKPEPDTPSVTETLAYIQKNSFPGLHITLDGTTLQSNLDGYQEPTKVDVLNLDPTKRILISGNFVSIQCKGQLTCSSNWDCGSYKRTCYDSELILQSKSFTFGFTTSDDTIAPHVANAFVHLIKLIQKQHPAPPSKEPF
jgi:hypothetical protein